MNMKVQGIGIDMIEIRRFRGFGKNNRFLKNNFSKEELDYCFSFKDSATHLAGTFATKEAVIKILTRSVPLALIEVKRNRNGKPEIFIKNRREKSIMVSISHTEKLALAFTIKND